MIVHVNWSALKQSRWYEYVLRFALGGLATALAGAAAEFFGPEEGGLFLAFPAIFCASATLIENTSANVSKNAGFPATAEESMPRPLTPPELDWEAWVSRRLDYVYGCLRRALLSDHWR